MQVVYNNFPIKCKNVYVHLELDVYFFRRICDDCSSPSLNKKLLQMRHPRKWQNIALKWARLCWTWLKGYTNLVFIPMLKMPG